MAERMVTKDGPETSAEADGDEKEHTLTPPPSPANFTSVDGSDETALPSPGDLLNSHGRKSPRIHIRSLLSWEIIEGTDIASEN